MNINTTIVKKIATMLVSTNSLSSGEGAFKSWVSELLTTCFLPLGTLWYGGILVPQIGEGAGLATSISLPKDSVETLELTNINDLIWSKWEDTELRPTSQTLSVPQENLNICIIPIAYERDEPIGMLWASLEEREGDEIESVLFFISKLILMTVYESKGVNALKKLATESWYEDSRDKIIEKVADLCAQAMSCKQVVVWEADCKEKELITKAVTGVGEALSLDLDFGQGLAGKCYEDNTPRIYDDLSIEDTYHNDIVRDYGLKSCIMVPLDVGGSIAGVMGVYAGRVAAFNELDLTITYAFAQRLCAGYLFANRLEELENLEKNAFIEAPAIEAGLLAMELVHDINDWIGFAQGELGTICSRYKKISDS